MRTIALLCGFAAVGCAVPDTTETIEAAVTAPDAGAAPDTLGGSDASDAGGSDAGGSDAGGFDTMEPDAAVAPVAPVAAFNPALMPSTVDVMLYLANDRPQWVGGVLVDPLNALAHVDSVVEQTRLAGGDPYLAAQSAYRALGLLNPDLTAHQLTMPIAQPMPPACTASCYLRIVKLEDKVSQNSSISAFGDVAGSSFSTAHVNQYEPDTPHYYQTIEDRKHTVRANVKLRCDYSPGCGAQPVGCSADFTESVRGQLYAWAYRTHNIRHMTARATSVFNATIFNPETKTDHTFASKQVALSASFKGCPFDDNIGDKVSCSIKLLPKPSFECGTDVSVTEVLQCLSVYGEETKNLEVGGGFDQRSVDILRPAAAGPFEISLGQIGLDTSRNADATTTWDLIFAMTAKAESKVTGTIVASLTNIYANPGTPGTKCEFSTKPGENPSFVISSGYGGSNANIHNMNCTVVGSTLPAGRTLHMGECLRSPNGLHYLVMQGDKHLVRYDSRHNAVWTEPKWWPEGEIHRLEMQGECNLVAYGVGYGAGVNNSMWFSGTAGKCDPDRLELDDTGTIKIISKSGAEVWRR